MRILVFTSGLLAVLGVAVCVRPAGTQPPAAPPRATVFSTLKVGQAVTVREKAGRVVVSTLDGADPQTHRVVEVGDEFVAVRDVAGLAETRLPASSVWAVVHTRPPGK